jgi:hypothetical protein
MVAEGIDQPVPHPQLHQAITLKTPNINLSLQAGRQLRRVNQAVGPAVDRDELIPTLDTNRTKPAFQFIAQRNTDVS